MSTRDHSERKGEAYWSSYQLEMYGSRKPPFTGTVEYPELEEMAREKLKDYPANYWYTFGSAGTNSTYRDNLRAFEKYKIIPRMLVDATTRSISTTLFGEKHLAPLVIAPVGVQTLMHPDAELATARAAAKVGVTYTYSSASSRSPDEVAQSNGDSSRWFQLYWPVKNEFTISLLKRAKDLKYTALVLTLDTIMLGWRPHDIKKAFIPFLHGQGIQLGTSDPYFMETICGTKVEFTHPEWPYDHEKEDKLIVEGDPEALQRFKLGKTLLGQTNSAVFRSWDDLKFLQEHWDGPIILKGIQAVEDAKKALEYGIQGIVVSNHGGRQVDGALPSLYALDKICADPEIVAAQKSGKLTVLFDSGIRTGPDVIKAIALGAQAVLLGRPFMYGLAVGGEQGVEHVIRSILADTEVTMGLAGFASLDDIWHKREILAKLDSW